MCKWLLYFSILKVYIFSYSFRINCSKVLLVILMLRKKAFTQENTMDIISKKSWEGGIRQRICDIDNLKITKRHQMLHQWGEESFMSYLVASLLSLVVCYNLKPYAQVISHSSLGYSTSKVSMQVHAPIGYPCNYHCTKLDL